MRVADVMTRELEMVSPDATVQDAARAMAERDIGTVLVGSGTALEGVLTDRDIILRAIVDGRNPTQIHVRDVMSADLFTCVEDDSAVAALQSMREHQVRRLPVLSSDGQLLGIVALCDLTKPLPHPETAMEALREITETHRHRNTVNGDALALAVAHTADEGHGTSRDSHKSYTPS